jgi:hypothetical protein
MLIAERDDVNPAAPWESEGLEAGGDRDTRL